MVCPVSFSVVFARSLTVVCREARDKGARAQHRRLKFVARRGVARILLGGCVPSSPGFRSTSVRSFVGFVRSLARSRPLPRRSRTSRCKVVVSCHEGSVAGHFDALSKRSDSRRSRPTPHRAHHASFHVPLAGCRPASAASARSRRCSLIGCSRGSRSHIKRRSLFSRCDESVVNRFPSPSGRSVDFERSVVAISITVRMQRRKDHRE